ncbi:MAG: polysaccharide deacetylase family protein [Candidatus Aceula meridiana]|nr:polysaccharide deacetylase family protein [Candidatus Aceula meridiana]
MSWIILTLFVFLFIGAGIFYFCVFFDQAILTRRGTLYRVKTEKKKVALTFDDGPSPIWTSQILYELKKEGIKATFFMGGRHVKLYPEVARKVAEEGHEIENHGYAHNVLFYYRPEEIEEEIKYTEHIIEQVTGRTTKYFRPPKAWLRGSIKKKIKGMGYEVVLWSLNSKDWVTFDARRIVNVISKRVKSGDILLFHDSGGVLKAEGGDRSQTVATIPLLARELDKRGFEFVTVDQLIKGEGQ